MMSEQYLGRFRRGNSVGHITFLLNLPPEDRRDAISLVSNMVRSESVAMAEIHQLYRCYTSQDPPCAALLQHRRILGMRPLLFLQSIPSLSSLFLQEGREEASSLLFSALPTSPWEGRVA